MKNFVRFATRSKVISAHSNTFRFSPTNVNTAVNFSTSSTCNQTHHGHSCSCCNKQAIKLYHTSQHLFQTNASSAKSDGVYVSQHYVINEHEISDLLKRNGMAYKIVGQEIVVRECPFCHDTKNQYSNLYKLYIHKQTGTYFCHRCSAKGSWFDFKLKIDSVDSPTIQELNEPEDSLDNKSSKYLPGEETDRYKKDFAEGKYTRVLDYLLYTRGISKETAMSYGVGATEYKYITQDENGQFEEKIEDSLTFPMYGMVGSRLKVVRHKIRSIESKYNMRLTPTGSSKWGLFGLATLFQKDKESKSIVLTEGEFDAMAIYEQTNIPAVSLPNGCRSLPVQLIPLLERFEKIYLWMDDDAPGQQGANMFAQKLGRARCYIVHSSDFDAPEHTQIKDANEALLKGVNLRECLNRAQPIKHDRITSFSTYKSEIFRDFYEKNRDDIDGLKSIYFSKLYNKTLKGFRRGELTIITGATGIGKTTILGQLSLDFAQQGVATLWGSFEIKNQRLMKKMLCQYAATDFSKVETSNTFDKWADKFSQLPLYFLNFYGSTSVEQVLDAMDYAVYVHDVQHILIDNLQFMTSGQGTGYEKFDIQDKVLSHFRTFATSKNVHISIVIHPRKVEDNSSLGIHSVFGSAKATQEADNILIIQKGDRYRYIEVRKNRFDGSLAQVAYKFDRNSNRIIELTDEEIDAAESGQLQLVY